jgi:hypothetical protein
MRPGVRVRALSPWSCLSAAAAGVPAGAKSRLRGCRRALEPPSAHHGVADTLKAMVPLLLLGSARLLTTKGLNYQVRARALQAAAPTEQPLTSGARERVRHALELLLHTSERCVHSPRSHPWGESHASLRGAQSPSSCRWSARDPQPALRWAPRCYLVRRSARHSALGGHMRSTAHQLCLMTGVESWVLTAVRARPLGSERAPRADVPGSPA